MAEISDLTPEQIAEIRAMPATPDADETPRQFVRHVEIDGIAIDVDMRRIKDYRAMSLIAEFDEGNDAMAMVRLFDFVLGKDRDRVIKAFTDDDDYCDPAKVSNFCAELLKECGAKNS